MAVFTIEVTNTGDMPLREIRTLLDYIINAGLAEAADTLEAGEGDVDMALTATTVNISAPMLVRGN